MKIFPQKNIVYKSKFSKIEVLNFLKDKIEKEKPFAISLTGPNYTKPYIGQILFNKFDIRRVIQYRNSFLPQISGEVFEENNGCTIKVKMEIVNYIKIFIAVWMGIVSIACIIMTLMLLSGKFHISFLGPYLMFLFGFFLVKIPFNFECKRSKTDLAMILKATIV